MGSARVNFHHHRHDQQCHDVDDLDQRVDRGASGVFVGIAHGVTGHGRLVRLGTFAAVVAVFNVLLGVVPGTTAGTHGNRDKQAGHDGAHQQPSQGRRAKHQAHHDRRDHG